MGAPNETLGPTASSPITTRRPGEGFLQSLGRRKKLHYL